MLRIAAITIVAAFFLSACTTVEESNPSRTATEQLLISTAADRAADNLDLRIPEGTAIFVDASAIDGTDTKYAVAAIRDSLLRSGARLMPERGKAEAVVELRLGALSIDRKQTLVGIPQFEVLVLPFPEIALYKTAERQGVAKIGATSYGVADGRLIASSGPVFGYSHVKDVVLLFFSWTSTDLPQEQTDNLFDDLYLGSP